MSQNATNPRHLPIPPPPSVCLSVCLSPSLSVSVSLCLSPKSIFLSVNCTRLCLSPFLLSVFLFLPLSLNPYLGVLAVCLCLCPFTLSVSVCLFVCLSLPRPSLPPFVSRVWSMQLSRVLTSPPPPSPPLNETRQSLCHTDFAHWECKPP